MLNRRSCIQRVFNIYFTFEYDLKEVHHLQLLYGVLDNILNNI